MKISFILNNGELNFDIDPLFPVLRLLREERGLSSVKTGCGEGECGACTVILGSLENGIMRYKSVASCILPAGELNGKHLVTLEGINGPDLSPVQEAFVDEGAIQCGFCTPGFMMSITGFFLSSKELTRENILNSIDGNICRCTGYYSIKKAAERVLSEVVSGIEMDNRILSLIKFRIIPEYFNTIKGRLTIIKNNIKETEDSRIIGKGTLFIAGGTDLLVSEPKNKGLDVQFVSEIKNISEIYVKKDFIHVGGGTTVEDIIDSEIINDHFPGISDFMYLISSQIIRNKATLGGNIVNASPIGDLSVLFLALDPVLDIKFGDKLREVYLKEFFKDYKVIDMEQGELILSMRIPLYPEDKFFNFEKVSRRKYLDIASCNSSSCFYLEGNIIKRCDLSAGGVAPVPLYLKESSSYLTERTVNEETIGGVIKVAMDEISPISDVRGSADYKRELLKRLIKAHFHKLDIYRNNAGGKNEQ